MGRRAGGGKGAVGLLLAAPGSIALVALMAARADAAPEDGADRASVEPVRVRLEAKEGCASAAAFLDAVRARTPRVREARDGEAARVFRVSLARRGAAVRGELTVVDLDHASAPRSFDGASCDEVVSALALVAALAVDPHASVAAEPVDAGPPPPPPPAPPAVAASPASDAPPPTVRTEPPAAPRTAPAAPSAPATSPQAASFRVTAGASFELVGVAAPGVAVGAGLFVDVGRDDDAWLTPTLRARVAHARAGVIAAGPGEGRFTWTTFEADVCPVRIRGGALSLRPCLAAEAGALAASAAGGVTSAQSRVRPWVTLGAMAVAGWSLLGVLVLEVQGGVRAPLVREDFVFRPDLGIYTPPPWILAGALGLGARFP